LSAAPIYAYASDLIFCDKKYLRKAVGFLPYLLFTIGDFVHFRADLSEFVINTTLNPRVLLLF